MYRFKVFVFLVGLVIAVAPISCGAAILKNIKLVLGEVTTIDSDANRLISYRHQDHMWMTSDGVHHLMANAGTLAEGGQGLNLYTQIDGDDWQWVTGFASTDSSTTNDTYVESGNDQNDILHLVYSAGSTIYYKKLAYSLDGNGWSLLDQTAVDFGSRYLIMNPSVTVDADGILWVVFVMQDVVEKNAWLQLYYKENDEWQNPGLSFGPDVAITEDDQTPDLSAKLLREESGVSMVYTNGHTLNWVERLNGWNFDKEWDGGTLFTHQPPYSLDLYASHFSSLIDSMGNRHLAFAEQEKLYYFRQLTGQNSWGRRIYLGKISDTAYMQLSQVNESIFLVANVGQILFAFNSDDFGTTFSKKYLLFHPLGNSIADAEYSFPRMETPGRSDAGYLPVFQQYSRYVDNEKIQSLLYFELPVD